jgi:catechol 2,3-dioxygenase-like lactoylglutathione lyase family enzyme
MDMKLEVVLLPVSDVDRAKRFYGQWGCRLDADFDISEDFRIVQVTPPGSECDRPRRGRSVPSRRHREPNSWTRP